MCTIVKIDCNRVTNFIPEAMKQLRNWGLWRLVPDKDDKLQKVPYCAEYRGFAKSNDPTTWSCFRRAVNEYRSNISFYKGLAFFTDGKGLIFVDIDHCISETGALNDVAQDIMDTLGDAAFWEVSQSGTGLHGFLYGYIENGFKNSKCGVEMYSSGRFCAMTGRALFEREPGHNDEGLLAVYKKYTTKRDTDKGPERSGALPLRRSDSYIIEKASEDEKSGDLFRQLMSGDDSGFQSRSEADFCLIKILYFWSDGYAETIKRIAMSSALFREKWNRADYLTRTIARAAAECKEVLSEYVSRREREKHEQHAAYLNNRMFSH